MNKMLKNRVHLIRAMIDSKKVLSDSTLIKVIDDIIGKIRKNENKAFLALSLDDNSKVSYSKSNENNPLNESRRIKTTLQRYIRRTMLITQEQISDAHLDKFANNVLTLTTTNFGTALKIFSGQEITNFYMRSGIESCMVGGCNSFKTSLYSLNPNKVQLVCYSDQVRALLWTDDAGNKILDRAYPSGHHFIELLRTWATRKGYLLRNNADQLTNPANNGISDYKDHYITLKHGGVFPYLDTFKYGEMSGDKIVLTNCSTFGNTILATTDGSHVVRVMCCKCKSGIENGSVLRDNYNNSYCRTCHDNLSFVCSWCGGKFFPSDQYGSWQVCNKCFSFMRGFSKNNKCSCGNCKAKIEKFNRIVAQNKVAETSKKGYQAVFEFVDSI